MSNPNYKYNAMFDILYLRLADSDNSYGHEDENGVIINYDYDTKRAVGADIWDFKRRISNKKPIVLPFQVDLHSIFSEINKLSAC